MAVRQVQFPQAPLNMRQDVPPNAVRNVPLDADGGQNAAPNDGQNAPNVPQDQQAGPVVPQAAPQNNCGQDDGLGVNILTLIMFVRFSLSVARIYIYFLCVCLG